jgi:hypothetical protein
MYVSSRVLAQCTKVAADTYIVMDGEPFFFKFVYDIEANPRGEARRSGRRSREKRLCLDVFRGGSCVFFFIHFRMRRPAYIRASREVWVLGLIGFEWQRPRTDVAT